MGPRLRQLRTWVRGAGTVAMAGAAIVFAPSCLPAELSDAELAAYCNSADDCNSIPGFACWEATCVEHKCHTNNKPREAGYSCWTPKCEDSCVCTPADAPVGPGKCLPPL